MAEAEVAAPPDQVWRQLFDHPGQTDPPGVMSRIRALNVARAFGAMRRSLPSFAMLNPRNLRTRHRAFRLIDLQPQLASQEPAHRGHHLFPGAPAANIDVAVVRVTAEPVTPSGQFLVEIVEHEVA